VVFCRGFIYETCFNKGSDKSDRYNMGIFHQSHRCLGSVKSFMKEFRENIIDKEKKGLCRGRKLS